MIERAEPVVSIYRSNNSTFVLLCCYLLFEFGRPQNLIPGLTYLHLPMLMLLTIGFRLVNNHAIDFSNKQVRLFLAMIILMVGHVPFAVNNYWAFQMSYVTVLYFIAGMGIMYLTRDIEEVLRIFRFLAFAFFILAVMGLIYKGKIPGSSTMGDENDFALAVNFAIPMFLFQALLTDSIKKKIFYFSAICIGMLAVISSMSRGGFVGFVPVAVYCWLRLPKKMIATIAAFIMLGIIAIQAPADYWDEIATIGQGRDEGTADLRMYYWERGGMMFLDNPIFGVGPGNFPWRIQEYEPPEGRHGRHHGSRPAHSLYFTLLPELGLVGTGIFAAMLWRFIKNKRRIALIIDIENSSQVTKSYEHELLKNIRYTIYMMEGGMIAYLVTGAFLSVLYYPYFWTIVCLNEALLLKTQEYFSSNRSTG
jgi:O-antigen ligase